VAPALIEQAIREAFGGQDYSVIEERNARTLIEQRLRAYHHLSSNARVRRLAGLLERRGFSTATITRVLRAVRRSTVKDALDD
ncbi:MAG TPA: RecX family transcriptional regulator, partial [bacterium]|nr:RecX family transcriptional regulator [bacterium]